MKKRLSLISILLFSHPIYAVDFDSILSRSKLTDIAGCEQAVRILGVKDKITEPLYRMNQGVCEAVSPSADEDYFSDDQCKSENTVRYKNQSRLEFCRELAQEKVSFGDGAKTEPEPGVWWQHPALSLDIGVESLSGNSIPFETRVVYKEVSTERGKGTCKLEMRIYKKRIGETGLKPLLMFHGGSWNARQGGMIGLQTQLSHYTDEGFVVFTPFYRLAREIEAETNVECNGVTGDEIVKDANDALDWVRDNSASYGGVVGSKGVLLAGQSAGGHLAASLAVHRPDQVSRALLFYPPTDFPSVIGDWQTNGIPENTLGLAAINGFIGESVETVDYVNNALVQANNFPKIAAANVGQIPPLYMIHGDADALVPVTQSVRLCNGLTGDADNGPASELDIPAGEARKVIQCDDAGSQLHVIAGADHILDVCVKLFGIDVVCPAGTAESQEAAKKSIVSARKWLTDGATGVTDSSDSGEREEASENGNRSGSGGGSVGIWVLLPLLFRRFRVLAR